MRNSFFLTVISLCMIVSSYGQSRSKNSVSYRTALGVKVWDGAGISLKHFFNTNNAGEIIGYFHRHGFRLEFGDGRGFSGSWGGLGIRYTF